MHMQRFVRNEATLGYKMPKMHQAPVALRCAMRIPENYASHSSFLHCHICQKRCQSTSPHRGTCGCPGGRASGKVRPRESVGSYDACALYGIKVLWSSISIWQLYRSGSGGAKSSARRCRTDRAWKLRAVMQSSCKSWASSKAAEAPSRLPWQPVSKRQLSGAPKLQWLQRPEG